MRALSETAVCYSLMSATSFIVQSSDVRGYDVIEWSQATSRMRPAKCVRLPPPSSARAMRCLKSCYRGFELIASSNSGRDGLHAASIRIEKLGYPARSFTDLDFFHDDAAALAYAMTWGRIWIEMNVRFRVPSQAAGD